MTLTKGEGEGKLKRGSTRSHPLEIWFRKILWICCKTLRDGLTLIYLADISVYYFQKEGHFVLVRSSSSLVESRISAMTGNKLYLQAVSASCHKINIKK
jgi:hypothetical protein